jgi:3'-phosphoadenosine 5'-phosphosulfate sulfotransferase (PAPS reductase)/FAD synthetase
MTQDALFTIEAPVPDLATYDLLLANLSGGKDSQTMLRVLAEAAERAGVRDRIVCVFADLGDEDEWPDAPELAAEHAAHYGLRFIATSRATTDPETGEEVPYGLTDGIERREMFPAPGARWCTSDWKRGPIRKVTTQLCRELQDAWRAAAGRARARPRKVRVLNVMGLRAQESTDRRLMPPLSYDEDSSNESVRHVDEWLPIHQWTVEEVWADIQASGVRYHWAYDLGMPRLSCPMCVYASESALIRASQIFPERARRRAEMEQRFTIRRAARMAAVLLAAANGSLTPAVAARLAKRIMRGGPLLKKGRPMAQIIAKAQAATQQGPVKDWAA